MFPLTTRVFTNKWFTRCKSEETKVLSQQGVD